MRLTTNKKPHFFKKLNLDNVNENQYFIKIKDQEKVEDFTEVANKLGQLEDIEEELGIDLITLFKALKNGIYAIVPDYDGSYIEHFEPYATILDMYSKCIDLRDDTLGCVALNHYGKTWALTKEELEDELQINYKCCH